MSIKQEQQTATAGKVWAIVDRLPQRDAIALSDARQWVGEVIDAHGEQAIWHAIRLNGFGGSEIGVLVRNKSGVRADHSASAHDIVAGKLMRKAPLEDSGHLRRGHENEPFHAQRFYEKYGCARDEIAFDTLKMATGKRPWMRYSPDDLVRMNLPQSGLVGLWLADYKAPSQVEESESIAFQYACQLTQGAILCAESGIQLNGMMLSQFDWANWRLKDDVVQWDEALGHRVIEAGDHYWNDFVLQGTLPRYVVRQKLEGIDEFIKTYDPMAQQLASLSALSKAVKDRADMARQQMVGLIGDVRLADKKIAFGVGRKPDLTIAAKKMMDREQARKHFSPEQLLACKKAGTNGYDVDGLVAALEQLGGNPKAFALHELDADKVFAMGESIGLDPEALVAEQLTVTAGEVFRQQADAYVAEHFPQIKVDELTPGDINGVDEQSQQEAVSLASG